MVTKKEESIIKQCAKKYNALSVLLFGSSLEKKKVNDIDLAVKGVKAEFFFDFYADLFKYLSRPVDLVDLDESDNYFTRRIMEEGRVIYEA